MALAVASTEPRLLARVWTAGDRYHYAGIEKYSGADDHGGGHRQTDRNRLGNFFRGSAIFHWRLPADGADLCRLFGSGVLARVDDDHPFLRQAWLAAYVRHRQSRTNAGNLG